MPKKIKRVVSAAHSKGLRNYKALLLDGGTSLTSDAFSNSWVRWEAYGVTPTDVDGWSFIQGPMNEGGGGMDAASDFGLTVLSPVEFSVNDGAVTVAGPSSWHERIRFVDGHLIFRLPLIAREASRVLLLPPLRGCLPPMVEVKRTAFTHSFGELEAVWGVNDHLPFTVLKGQPISHVVALAGAILPETIENNGLYLRIWRLHPRGVRICPAEKTLRGDASAAATRWCGPFTHANAYGFWVFSPCDLDVVWHGGRSFDYRFESLYTDEDASLISRLQRPEDSYRYAPRKKIEFGSTLESVVSIWTGCIFQTPPGWSLMIRDPINITASAIFRVQEGILETDWLPYDIWINLLFIQQDKWARIRRADNWPPIAQLVPVPTAAYDRPWSLTEGPLERTSADGRDLYSRWVDYNYKKWVEKGQKEPATYSRQRHLHKTR